MRRRKSFPCKVQRAALQCAAEIAEGGPTVEANSNEMLEINHTKALSSKADWA